MRALTLHTLDTHPYNSGTKKWFHVFVIFFPSLVTTDTPLKRSNLELFSTVSLVTKLGGGGKLSQKHKTNFLYLKDTYIVLRGRVYIRKYHMHAGLQNFAVDLVHKQQYCSIPQLH